MTSPPPDPTDAQIAEEAFASVTGPLWRRPCAAACTPARYPRVRVGPFPGDLDVSTVCADCGRVLSSLHVHDEARHGPHYVDGLD